MPKEPPVSRFGVLSPVAESLNRVQPNLRSTVQQFSGLTIQRFSEPFSQSTHLNVLKRRHAPRTMAESTLVDAPAEMKDRDARTDQELIAAINAGDAAAFDTLYLR